MGVLLAAIVLLPTLCVLGVVSVHCHSTWLCPTCGARMDRTRHFAFGELASLYKEERFCETRCSKLLRERWGETCRTHPWVLDSSCNDTTLCDGVGGVSRQFVDDDCVPWVALAEMARTDPDDVRCLIALRLDPNLTSRLSQRFGRGRAINLDEIEGWICEFGWTARGGPDRRQDNLREWRIEVGKRWDWEQVRSLVLIHLGS